MNDVEVNPWKQGYNAALEHCKDKSETAEYPSNPYVDRDKYKEWEAGLGCGFKAFYQKLKERE